MPASKLHSSPDAAENIHLAPLCYTGG